VVIYKSTNHRFRTEIGDLPKSKEEQVITPPTQQKAASVDYRADSRGFLNVSGGGHIRERGDTVLLSAALAALYGRNTVADKGFRT
jgi:hypothetical protein